MMVGSNAFIYSHRLHDRNVRLLDVIPGLESSRLEIRLIERDLGEAEFEALSYVWGTGATKLITCNGCWLSIGSNLHDSLWERRRRQSKALLWADAICINQDDDQEKTHQVRFMGEIYAKADRVIIWIGKEGPKDLEAYELAKSLYQECDGERYDIDAGKYDFEDFDYETKGVPCPSHNPAWIALFQIISHSWFGRVWIIQELLVAQRSTMWRGARDFDTHIILWSAMLVGRHRNLYSYFNINMNSPQTSALMARSIAASYFDYKKKGPLPLYDTLSRHSGMGATDSRDRFFALAGVSAGLDLNFVNYEKSFQEIACLVGKMTLLGFSQYDLGPGGTEMLTLNQTPRDHRFLIEWLAFHANPQNHKLGLPSWIPDLLSAHSPGLLMTGFYNTLYLQEVRDVPSPQVGLRHGGHYNISKPFQDFWQIPIPDDIDIKGAIFDSVRLVARDRPCLPKADMAGTQGQLNRFMALEEVSRYETEMVYWLSEIRRLADRTLSANDGMLDGSYFDAFWRTLIYNRGPCFNCKSPNQQPPNRLAINFGYWYLWKKLQMTKRWRNDFSTYVFHSKILEKLAAPFEKAEGRVRHARNFLVTQEGRIGWAPFRTQAGDRVCVLYGMRIPVILRSQGSRWEFIGACYVHGLMDGEVWDLDGLQWDFMSFV